MDMQAREDPPAPRRILLVEDDPDMRETLADSLRMLGGHEVVAVQNGVEALTYLRNAEKPELIVLDLMMPVMDGWEFRLEQRRDPKLAETPVLAISADSSCKARAIDAEAYLAKPIDVDQLLAVIEETISTFERRNTLAKCAQADRLASLGTLAAGVAHEINNPLTYVLANLKILSQRLGGTMNDHQVADMLDEAIQGAERIGSVVRDMRTFSRSDDESRVALDVRNVIDTTLQVVIHEIQKRARLIKSHGKVPLVMASEGRLAQVFLNLIVNTLQAFPDGDPGRYELRIVTKTSPAGEAVVEITDNGVGIPACDLPRIFEPFFTSKPVGIGIGLGLSICHGIVTSLGGRIAVASEVGQGTTFQVVLLPCDPAAAEEPTKEPCREPCISRARILIVDDEPAVARALKNLLQDVYDVSAVHGGRDALALLARDARFDLILCDLHMPEVSGMEIFAHLKEAAVDLEKRVVFMTGGAFTEKARRFLQKEKPRCIEKPFHGEHLLTMVSEWLGEH
ncbi:MAG: response regulator [Deltaproteobacteria bacterium]|nr:response regulator [Deltaproteobacteria bacterium]